MKLTSPTRAKDLLIFLGLLLVFISLNQLANKWPLRLDLTEEKEFTLADSTKKITQSLSDNLTIKFFVSSDLPEQVIPLKQMIDDFVHEYQSLQKSKITLEVLDPSSTKEIKEQAEQIGILPIELNVIEKDKQVVKKIYLGMALYYQDKMQVLPAVTQVDELEYNLDLALLKMTKSELPKVGVFIDGGADYYKFLPQVISPLATMIPISHESKKISEQKLDALFLINPVSLSKEFENEIDALYKKNVPIIIFGGNVDVSGSLNASAQTFALTDWLEKQGLLLTQELLVDIAQNEQAGFQNGMMQVYMPYPFWIKSLKANLAKSHPLTSGLEEILFPWTNAIEMNPSTLSQKTVTILAQSSDQAFLQEGDIDVNPEYINQLTSAPLMKSRAMAVNLTEDKKSLTVFASPYMIQDSFLQQSQANVIFLSHLVESFAWGEHLQGIRTRGQTTRPLPALEQQTKQLLKGILTLGVPFIIILKGAIFAFIMKRKRQSQAHKMIARL